MKKVIRLTESDLTRLVKKVIAENNSSHRRYKRVNESLLGSLGILAVGALALSAGGLYTKAKRMWSKYVTGKKYEPTGRSETIYNEEKDVDITIEQFKDKEGNLYWGWEHMWNPDPQMDTPKFASDLYRAMFDEKDKARLERFLKGIKVETSIPSYDYLDKPKPVDMIFLKDFDEERNTEDFHKVFK
jgi:hypothetical protein